MATRKVLVLGATGGTGQQVVSQALKHGHDVTVLACNPQRLDAGLRDYISQCSLPPGAE